VAGTVHIVFFDAGETLLSPQPSFSELAATVISSRGHDVDPDEMLQAFRKVGVRFRTNADEGRTFSTSADESRMFWEALYGEVLDILRIDDPPLPGILCDTFSDPSNYDLYPDARPCLHTLAERGKRLGVISNFEPWLGGLLERLEVTAHFDVVAISGDLGWEKPDKRIFEWAVEQSGVPAEACAMVGDQPYFDAEAAIAVGMRGVLLDRHGRYGDIEVDYPRITSLSELPDVIEGL
jgi:putative hydrolase of the HAD superfamily